METKVCKDCGTEKPISDFFYVSTREWRVPRCKPCYNKKQKALRDARIVDFRAKQNLRRANNPAKFMLYSTRQSARERGLPHTISEADFSIPDVCPILGIPLKNGVGCAIDNSPSLDRIDPTKGYVPGNVQVISYKANTMKTNATPAEMLAFATWVIKNYQIEKAG